MSAMPIHRGQKDIHIFKYESTDFDNINCMLREYEHYNTFLDFDLTVCKLINL